MFYSLRGALVHTEPGLAVIECGGVGYKCFISRFTQGALPNLNEQAKLFTTLVVREDAMDLYGFHTASEQNCFKLLTNISGVGAKVAIAVLSELSPEQIALAAASGDSKSFARANGVGPKLAQRIVLELKDKVSSISVSGTATQAVSAAGVVSASKNAQEAVSALTVLGYSQSEAAAAVGRFDSALPVEELIRLSLRFMAQK